MRKSIRRLASVALVLILLSNLAALADVVTTGNVYLRTGPGLGYSKITAVPPGTTLEYLGETSVDDRGVAWYKVSHNGACWVSSRYSTLRNEPAAPSTNSQPAAPSPTSVPAGNSFSNELVWGVVEHPLPGTGAAQDCIEISPYYLNELTEAAAKLSLTNNRQVTSEAPNQYYNASLTIGGYSHLTYCELTGSGYSLFGAKVGMNAADAKATLQSAGLTLYSDQGNTSVFEHRGDGKSFFVDDRGFDSCINLECANGVVTRISWSSYTG